MRQSDLPANGTLTAEYNPNGTVKSAKDGMGNITNFEYHPNGDLHNVTRPLGVGNMTYEYDAISRVKKTTDAKNQVTEHFYDALDRLTEAKFAAGSSIVNTYDAGGRLTRRDDRLLDATQSDQELPRKRHPS